MSEEDFFEWASRTQDISILGSNSFPVIIGSEVIAVLEFFSEEQTELDELLLKVLNQITAQVGRVIERRKTEEKLRKINDELEEKVKTRTQELQALNNQLEVELRERKNLETQLVHVQKMESLGQLAAGVAHEINNPIGFVSSNMVTLSDYVETFKKIISQTKNIANAIQNKNLAQAEKFYSEIEAIEAEDDLPFVLDDVDALLKESKEGLNRVKEIVQDLKSFARLDESDNKEADINECLDSTLKLVWNELKYKCIVNKKYARLPNLICNAGHLNQVFMNLLVNAAHAIPEKGVITIETVLDRTDIVVKISDTGKGIPEEELAKIFDPFFTTKPVGKGTGLGLSISYGIIADHGGEIRVESTVGVGTSFTIRLPLTHGMTIQEPEPGGKP